MVAGDGTPPGPMNPTEPTQSQTRAFLFADLRGYSAYTSLHGGARMAGCWVAEAARSTVRAKAEQGPPWPVRE